jgi:hypothetical protein
MCYRFSSLLACLQYFSLPQEMHIAEYWETLK